METNNPNPGGIKETVKATQPPLTPEAANPPPEVPKKNPASGKYNVIPDKILPPEDKPILSREERRKKRIEDY